MIEALWSVDFSTNLGMHGFGIAVFETKRILGGDSGMIYVGSYEVLSIVKYTSKNTLIFLI